MSPQKPRPLQRPLQIPDMLILIGGVAVAVVLIRRQWDLKFSAYLESIRPLGWSFGGIFGYTLVSVYVCACIGSVGAVAFLAIRLRGPRPPRPRLTTQPGLVACAAVTLVLALGEFEYLVWVKLGGIDNPFREGFNYESFLVLTDGVGYAFQRNGYAVAAAWLTLMIGRRWRPEPSWVDRSGRVIGVFWLLMIPLYTYINLAARS
jgi:hypothetical protein